MKTDRPQRETFVVRILRDQDQTGWQAWVQHIRSSETILARNFGELLNFLIWKSGGPRDPRRKGLK
jgi:hypothetical protein